MTLYVGNLSYKISEQELNEVFAEYGAVKQVKLPVDRETGQARGFAFVDMDTETAEASAIDALDGAEWMGRTLKVNVAKPRTDKGGYSGNRRSRAY
ncbi:MAG: RNA-binding protein [Cyanobacteria bacterium KgW148]|nr:RNA-binding protein [Cyanobacteria bacterium KgW148]